MENNNYLNTINELKYQRIAKRRIDFTLRAYTIIGLLIAVFAMGYFVLTFFHFDLTTQQRLALTFAGVGLALAVMSRSLLVLRRARESEENERFQEYKDIYDFLEAWAMFESASKQALERKDEDINKYSLRAVISRLQDEGKIDKADVQALENALQARNELVHGGRSLSSPAVRKTTEILMDIIQKLTTIMR